MAFGKGSESTDVQVTRYTGVASVYVRGLNPTKEELEKFYGREIAKVPEYVGVSEINGEQVPNFRMDFLVEADPEKYENVNLKTKVSLFLRKAYRFNRDKTKVQVIDKYGRTAWVTIEQAKAHEIPVYKNGPANIDKDYRPAYIGEEELIQFLIAYLNIPSCHKYINKQWVMNSPDKLADSEAQLEHIEDYFKGDWSELKAILGYQPNNKLKVLFGVKTDPEDGRQYQTAFTRMFLKNNVDDYTGLNKEYLEAKASGAYSTSEFDLSEIHEYVVTPTDFSAPAASQATPWGL